MSFRFQTSGRDEWYTPESAVEYIVPFLDKGRRIWCPFDTKDSNFVKVLKREGFDVIHTHIWDGQDFLTAEVPECDYIVSNPPFSIRDKVFKRLYEIGKPFAMVNNINGIFDSKKRYEMFMNNKFEMLIPKGRIKFINDLGEGEKTNPIFQSIYVCSNVLPKQIVFTEEEMEV